MRATIRRTSVRRGMLAVAARSGARNPCVDPHLRTTLDQCQQVEAMCGGAAVRDGAVLSIPVSSSQWTWTEYGGTTRHEERFAAGRIETRESHRQGSTGECSTLTATEA